MVKFSKKQTQLIGTIIVIAWATGSITLVLYAYPQMPEIEQEQKAFIFVLTVSLIGILLMFLKRKGLNKYTIESFELLFLFILPSIALIPVLAEPKIHL